MTAMLAPFLPPWADGAGTLLLYLAPSLALAFLIWRVTTLHPVFFVFNVAGTFTHELAHFSVGLLLNAEPTGLSIVPRRHGRTWELGSVTFANLRWYNAAPAALAPFLVRAGRAAGRWHGGARAASCPLRAQPTWRWPFCWRRNSSSFWPSRRSTGALRCAAGRGPLVVLRRLAPRTSWCVPAWRARIWLRTAAAAEFAPAEAHT